MDFKTKLQMYVQEGTIPARFGTILEEFYRCYKSTLEDHQLDFLPYQKVFFDYLEKVKEQIASPYAFAPYHAQILQPFDYHSFGLDFVRPLIDKKISSIHGLEEMKLISSYLETKCNVVFLANHQVEADPHAINILLEPYYPKIGKEMIFVAGERVLTDPLAIPFSMGRNLLCIYSKRYIDHPPELKTKKQLHNKKTMETMRELLSEGGKCIYVAPSGGRDRPNAEGIVEVAPFDPQSIEMFYLMAQKAKNKTYFFPMSLATYDLLPPPQNIQHELGEVRKTKRGGIHLSIGPCIDMEHFPGSLLPSKHERREARAKYIWNLVKEAYLQFPNTGAI